MKKQHLFFSFITGVLALLPLQSNAYVLGLHTENNDADEIRVIEKRFDIYNGVVGFIFDEFGNKEAARLTDAIKKLGRDRIYHVTVSPLGKSAKEVAAGKNDLEYWRFFSVVKSSGAHFVFRTMHEMNGSWYSWSGNPEEFKAAWAHVYALSRSYGLDTKNILFDFSVNSEDLPSVDGSVGGELIYCTPTQSQKTGCYGFEDFLPPANQVDILGVTVYNWGRGRTGDWSKWHDFRYLVNGGDMGTFRRLQSLKKPIFIDEVGTTSVDFTGSWSQEAVRESYLSESGTLRKDAWLKNLAEVVDSTPEIRGVLYFNRDKTNGLTDRTMIGELDWAALSFRLGKSYSGALDMFTSKELDNGYALFNRSSVTDHIYDGINTLKAYVFGDSTSVETERSYAGYSTAKYWQMITPGYK